MVQAYIATIVDIIKNLIPALVLIGITQFFVDANGNIIFFKLFTNQKSNYDEKEMHEYAFYMAMDDEARREEEQQRKFYDEYAVRTRH